MPIQAGNRAVRAPGAELAFGAFEHTQREVEPRDTLGSLVGVGREMDARSHEVRVPRNELVIARREWQTED
jgi:hypothetical protein